MLDFLQAIANDVADVFSHDIEATKAYVVPGRDDVTLTFSRDQVKKGKLIETAVLFIDIRNSTSISRRFSTRKDRLGKIYSAFIHAMTSIADRYGYIRNIIGDRVMVVFEPADCFANAMDCAIAMYTTATKILRPLSGVSEFKVGIGISYGEMLVLKTGIQKQHAEKSEYKNLVWVGDAANVASKLTDLAGKDYYNSVYKVNYDKVELLRVPKQTNPFSEGIYPSWMEPQKEYELRPVTRHLEATLPSKDFERSVSFTEKGIKYEGNSVTNIQQSVDRGAASPILMSYSFYRGFRRAHPKSEHLRYIFLKSYKHGDAIGECYGCSILAKDYSKIKL